MREYRDGDEESIRELYHLVFGEEISAQHWAWRYKQNPSGQPVIALAESSQGIVGQYALTPLRMKVEDKICLGSLSLHTMVHSDYRGQGMFTTLARKAYELAAERGIHFIYGFPNEDSHHGFITHLDWVDLYDGIPLWVKPLDWETVIKKRLVDNKLLTSLLGKTSRVAMKLVCRSRKGTPVCSVRELATFDERFDSLWDEASRDYNILAVRDKIYLSWRYEEKPSENYTVFIAESGEKLLGFIVVKCMERFGLQSGFIMDMVVIPEELRVSTDLVSAAVNYCEMKRMDMVGCLMLPGVSFSRTLKQAGFVSLPKRLLPQGMYLGVCNFTSQYPTTYLADPGNWFITWGDHDDM